MSDTWFAAWLLITAMWFVAVIKLVIVMRMMHKKLAAQRTVIRRQAEVITALRAFIADAATGKRDSDKVLDEEFIEG